MQVALVIEDDPVTRRVIAQVLMREGYGVSEGASADLIPFVPGLSVIVSDVVTRPDAGVIRAWADDLTLRMGVPVVLVTARSELVTVGAAALGVSDIVAKPFDVNDLVARVRTALDTYVEPRAA